MTILAEMEYIDTSIEISWPTIAIGLAIAASVGLLIIWFLLRKRSANRGGS